jgi:hypothetical protein
MDRARVAAVALLASGCASFGSHVDPTPVDPGRLQASLSADVLLVDRGFGYDPLPAPELALRWGLVRDVDWGLAVHALGARTEGRLRILREGVFELSILPSLGLAFTPATNDDVELFMAVLGARIIGALEASASVRIVLGVRVDGSLGFSAAPEPSGAIWLAPIAGVAIDVGPATLLPELLVATPYDIGRETFLPPLVQLGFTVAWDPGGPGP